MCAAAYRSSMVCFATAIALAVMLSPPTVAQVRTPSTIIGLTDEELTALFGAPSLRQDDGKNAMTWYYDATTKGTVIVEFRNGRVSRIVPDGMMRELAARANRVRPAPSNLEPVDLANTRARSATSQSDGRLRRVEIPGASAVIPGPTWTDMPLTTEEVAASQQSLGTPMEPGSMLRFYKNISNANASKPEDVRVVYATVLTLSRPDIAITSQELLAQVKGEVRVGDMITGRQRLIAFDANVDASRDATCVKYRRITHLIDVIAAAQAPHFPNATFVLDATGLFCVHPNWRQYIVDANFNQFYALNASPLDVAAERETFLNSILFTAVRPAAFPDLRVAFTTQMQQGTDAFNRNQWDVARTTLEQALQTARLFGDTPIPAAPLYYLGDIALETRRDDAESLLGQALQLLEKYPEVQDDPMYGATLSDLAIVYARRREFERAEPLMLRGLESRARILGSEHADVRRSLYSLARLYSDWSRWPEAEQYASRALPLVERDFGPNGADTRELVYQLAVACLLQGKVTEGKEFVTRFLAIYKVAPYPEFKDDLAQLVGIYRKLGREADAVDLTNKIGR